MLWRISNPPQLFYCYAATLLCRRTGAPLQQICNLLLSRRWRSSPYGSKNHRTSLYCRQVDFPGSRSTEIRFGGSAPRLLLQAQLQRCSTSISFRLAASLVRLLAISLTLRRTADAVSDAAHRALRYAPDIVRSQPRTASLLSGNSVLRAAFIQMSEADSAAAAPDFPE